MNQFLSQSVDLVVVLSINPGNSFRFLLRNVVETGILIKLTIKMVQCLGYVHLISPKIKVLYS